MSCNKKMSLVPFTFKNVELKVVTINGKPWTRAKEVCKALENNKKHVIRPTAVGKTTLISMI